MAISTKRKRLLDAYRFPGFRPLESIREYIRHQEAEDKRIDRMNLWRRTSTERWGK